MRPSILNRVHQLDALQNDAGRTKGFESGHRSNNAFDGPMVLFDAIVRVFALAYLDRVTGLLLVRPDSRGIGSALVDCDLVR